MFMTVSISSTSYEKNVSKDGPDNVSIAIKIAHFYISGSNSSLVPPQNNLDSCLRTFFQKRQKSHDGLSDSDLLRQVAERASRLMGYSSTRSYLMQNENVLRPFQPSRGKLHMIALVRWRQHQRDQELINRVPKSYWNNDPNRNSNEVGYRPVILYSERCSDDLRSAQRLEKHPVIKVVVWSRSHKKYIFVHEYFNFFQTCFEAKYLCHSNQ